jgi:hypothetical protein
VKNASPMGRIRLASLGGAPDTPRGSPVPASLGESSERLALRTPGSR